MSLTESETWRGQHICSVLITPPRPADVPVIDHAYKGWEAETLAAASCL